MFSQVSTGRLVEEAHEKLSQGPVAESGYVVDTEAQEQEQEIVTSGRHPSQLSSSRNPGSSSNLQLVRTVPLSILKTQ